MSNMSYCRFENTLKDLEDCYENWELDESAPETEESAQSKLLALCQNIVSDYIDEEEGTD